MGFNLPISETIKGYLKWIYWNIRLKGVGKVSLPCRIDFNTDLKMGRKSNIYGNTKVSGKLTIGDYSAINQNSYIESDVEIGKFCSIAENVCLISQNHPQKLPSTYLMGCLFGWEENKLESGGKIIIGNDVWIGHGAKIKKGITIGDGAIIGMGAVVTKNVEPYAVMVGNPATCKRKRFSDKKIKELLELKWWDWTDDMIKKNKDFFTNPID